MATQQQMCNAWMTGQLCHRLAMLGQLPIVLQRAKAAEQVIRL